MCFAADLLAVEEDHSASAVQHPAYRINKLRIPFPQILDAGEHPHGHPSDLRVLDAEVLVKQSAAAQAPAVHGLLVLNIAEVGLVRSLLLLEGLLRRVG